MNTCRPSSPARPLTPARFRRCAACRLCFIRSFKDGPATAYSVSIPAAFFMKGTANMSGTDIDLFISLSEQTTETLKEIYDKLFNTMKANGYTPTRQNVSINVRTNGYAVDLVPGKRQNSYGDDHSL